MKAEKSRSERVRELIREMGFAVKNPPPNWREAVEKRLAAEGITLNPSAIYKAQRKLLAAAGRREAKTRPAPGRTTPPSGATEGPRTGEANGRPATMPAIARVDEQGAEIKARHLVILSELANEIGGWDELLRAVEWLRRIKFVKIPQTPK